MNCVQDISSNTRLLSFGKELAKDINNYANLILSTNAHLTGTTNMKRV